MKKTFPAVGASLSLVCLVIFYFIYLSPMMTDNYVFSRELSPGYAKFYSGQAVEALQPSVAGAFRQACEMYSTWCGRFTGNLMVYLLFLLPHWLYCIVASLAFGLYALILQMCVFGAKWRQNLKPGWILATAALLWLAIPSFGEAFFWLSVGGQIALLGQALMFLPFRFALDSKEPPQRTPYFWPGCIGLFLAGIFTTSLDYPTSASMPVTGIVCAGWIWFWRRKFPMRLFCACAGLCLGAILTLTAPGNQERLRLTNDPTIHEYLATPWGERILNWLGQIPGAIIMEAIPLAMIGFGCVALWNRFGSSWPKHIPVASGLFLLPAMLTYGAYLFTAWPPPRAFATCTAQLLVCGLILLWAGCENAAPRVRHAFILAAKILGIVCVCSLLLKSVKFFQLHEIAAEREHILENAKETAILPPMPAGSGDRYWVLGKYLPDVEINPDFWVNRAVALHYGLKQVSRAPIQDTDWRYISGNLTADVLIHNEVAYVKVIDDGAVKPGYLHLYYYGKPALLSIMPLAMGRFIFNWLADTDANSWKNWLVPILLGREEIPLRDMGNGVYEGVSDKIYVYSEKRFWIVQPGQGPTSFDIEPLGRVEFSDKDRAAMLLQTVFYPPSN